MYSRLIILVLGLLAHSQVLAQDNCTEIDTCEECTLTECQWVQCLYEDSSCQRNDPAEFCELKECNSTTTTTEAPTTPTTEAPTTPTTEVPTTTTEVPTTTTEAPTTPAPTEAPTTPAPTEAPTTPAPTEAPTTPAPTEVPTTTTEATTTVKPCPPCPSNRHFDAASFFGGIVLAVAILAVAYAAWRFYKSRNERNYHTL
ncbi:hypothetical protein OTU49_004681 [Cherax quadricarinatus]|uniref:Uncharacterized protein n=2 Tax=Cherax quadricarinatus TaxID=27406 RepID=A0AAW0WXM7_CHEQU